MKKIIVHPENIAFLNNVKSDFLKKIILLIPAVNRWKILLHIYWPKIFGLFHQDVFLIKIEFKTIFLSCNNSCLSNEVLLQKSFFFKKINDFLGEIKIDKMQIFTLPRKALSLGQNSQENSSSKV